MKKLYYILLMGCLFAACENDPYLYQDVARIWLSGDEEQGATADSLFYSFRLYDFDVVEADLNLVVNLTGDAVGYDRSFALEVVDSLTNVPEDAYNIGESVLPAGAFQAVVPVKVKRSVTGLDLSHENAKLTLRVAPSDELGLGVEEFDTYSLVWCDYLVEPESWSIISYYIGPFSQARYKFIIDFTGYTDFSEFNNDYNGQLWLQGILNDYLEAYNEDPANEGRPEGWPYQNDNGDPLQFGEGLDV